MAYLENRDNVQKWADGYSRPWSPSPDSEASVRRAVDLDVSRQRLAMPFPASRTGWAFALHRTTRTSPLTSAGREIRRGQSRRRWSDIRNAARAVADHSASRRHATVQLPLGGDASY